MLYVRHNYIDKISKLNNKVLRILQHKEFRSHVPTLYSEFNSLPVTLLREQQLLILAHKIIHHSESVPEIFIDFIIQMIVCILITPNAYSEGHYWTRT